MSYLVQGSPINSGSDTDGSAMALSMAGSALLNSSLGSSLNSVEGVSNVEFGAQGSDKETAATVSGYFGEKIYLSYGIGLYEPVDVLTARFYLATRLWVEVVSSLMNSADLYYSFDID